MFECVVGYAPFCSMDNNPRETYQKIMNWPTSLVFPDDVYLSPEAEKLIRGLMNWKEQRLDLDQIKRHKFFEGVDWSILRDISAPWVPTLKNITDTSYFPVNELEGNAKAFPPREVNSAADLAFLKYVHFHCCYFRISVDRSIQLHFQEAPKQLMKHCIFTWIIERGCMGWNGLVTLGRLNDFNRVECAAF